MTIEMAHNVSRFLSSNDIHSIQLMGGEFVCHPQWREIFDIIVPNLQSVRLVTNGDWANDKTVPLYLREHKNIFVSISRDEWHTNLNVDRAISLCEENVISYNVCDPDEATNGSLVPIGRGELLSNSYSLYSCYCNNPKHQYSFLIDEDGIIYKCAFGVWDYAEVTDFLDGGFSCLFKHVNSVFYDTFISNCQRCIRAYERNGR
jgi:MoaA/NifB/PqqE/SkfB family radical SAM enzyme